MSQANNDIKLKTSMIRSTLCDYSDAYIHVKGNMKIPNTGTLATKNNRDKKVTFKNCTPFTNFISKINNAQIDYANVIDVLVPIYNLIEYNNIYSKTSGGF